MSSAFLFQCLSRTEYCWRMTSQTGNQNVGFDLNCHWQTLWVQHQYLNRGGKYWLSMQGHFSSSDQPVNALNTWLSLFTTLSLSESVRTLSLTVLCCQTSLCLLLSRCDNGAKLSSSYTKPSFLFNFTTRELFLGVFAMGESSFSFTASSINRSCNNADWSGVAAGYYWQVGGAESRSRHREHLAPNNLARNHAGLPTLPNNALPLSQNNAVHIICLVQYKIIWEYI